MKKSIILISFLLSLFVFSCATKTQTEEVLAPVPVQKEKSQRIYMHMMTWFSTDEDNLHPNAELTGNPWYGHWAKHTRDPRIIDPVTGQRQIAAHFYPLTGPYSSQDRNIIEYQLLLMKLAGVDGIIFNASTTNPEWDFPMLIRATDAIASMTQQFGLDFAIMYESQHVRDANRRGELHQSPMETAQKDMLYFKNRYFSEPNYIHVNGRPLLLDFGPQYFNTEAEWTEIFSVFGDNQPAFFALNYHGYRAGKNTYGEFAWIGPNHMADLYHFYNYYQFDGARMGVAYPGFLDYYKEGGVGDGYFIIHHFGNSTLVEILRLAFESDVDIIQLATWNDFGEGTMFEPTVEFGFKFLATLQRELGVKNLTERDLELVFELYQARVKYADNEEVQQQLDRASALMAALRINEARRIIEHFR